MAYRTFRKPATYLTLLMGSAFFPGLSQAAVTPEAGLHASNTLAPALMLARNWKAGLDPSEFLVSEKLDGVRAFWDGHVLRFRSGRIILAPNWFTAALPATALDGELWLGRGRFDRLSGLVRRATAVDAEWLEVRYVVFDLPGQPGSFGERSAQISAWIKEINQPWLQMAAQQRLMDAASLQSLLKQVVQAGGEGLVLHRANALWSPGRSSDALYKLKPVPDEDARVIAHLAGKGRHAGRMGSLLLELSDGQRFALGSGFTQAQRAAPPPVGALVTYRYRERTPKGLPRFASFLRVREAE
jgi:DNA ligase-1